MNRTLRLAALLAVFPLAARANMPPPGMDEKTPNTAEVKQEVAKEEADEPLPPGMTAGPAKVTMGANAELKVLEGTVFGDAKVTQDMMKRSGNLVSGQEVGILLNGESTVVFEFDPVGYVKDDDKDALDADKMLTSLRENQDAANEELKKQGLNELELTGWQVKPHYDPATRNLEWAPLVKNKTDGSVTVNYNVRILGRRGVMEATLLVEPAKFDGQLPWFRDTLKNFGFTKGEDYAAFRSGDKVAEYGLAALVTGGVVAAAAKSGLLGKLWKVILVGIAALGGAIKKLFGGSKSSTSVVAQDQQQATTPSDQDPKNG